MKKKKKVILRRCILVPKGCGVKVSFNSKMICYCMSNVTNVYTKKKVIKEIVPLPKNWFGFHITDERIRCLPRYSLIEANALFLFI